MRSKLYKIVRDFLHQNEFVEIETPILMKSTPEGARDFLVPSRNYNGKFYYCRWDAKVKIQEEETEKGFFVHVNPGVNFREPFGQFPEAVVET